MGEQFLLGQAQLSGVHTIAKRPLIRVRRGPVQEAQGGEQIARHRVGGQQFPRRPALQQGQGLGREPPPLRLTHPLGAGINRGEGVRAG